MVLQMKLSRASAFVAFGDLCDELATVDHLAVNSLLTGHLSTGAQVPILLKPYIYCMFNLSSVTL